MQAVHDLLFLGPRNLVQFDHSMFPGVVPRTFLAPAAVAVAASLPVALLLRFGAIAKLAAGVFSRATLALFSVAALSRLRGAVEVAFSRRASVFLALLTALQFHLPFYLSRTLPNTFATVVTTVALADWVDGRAPRRALVLLAAAAAALRCDVVLLAPPVSKWIVQRLYSLKHHDCRDYLCIRSDDFPIHCGHLLRILARPCKTPAHP